ncbi:HAD family hydrolase [Amnibacterium kyonggiense]|uniref:Sugar-phosphatase n=1 Tax=Amnibacterium kyonggiense TaxID=595671 RepID=A0A4R7FLN9_9MICO|nr:HAD-IA family hydrolase [Amnibacterium kyonggiense]TDS77307.1 sugar-phosphatase [Amnibacterium kyonggiense]
MPAEFLVRALLFDMDGTLIDSTPAVDRSWATWEQRWNVRLGVRASALGMPARDIVAARVAPEDAEAAFLDIERLEVADTDGIVVLPGVRELLAAIPEGRWAVATSCSAPLAAARLAAAGIEPPVLVTASDTALGKPNPDPYLAAAERLGVPPEQCLVIEDAVAGVAAGRSAGARTLGVLGSVPADLLGADAVAADLAGVRVEADGNLIRVVVDQVVEDPDRKMSRT